MGFKQYSPEELKECSMIEVVHSVLGNKRQATTFNELVQEIAQVLGLSQGQVNTKLAQFYTDLNIDGRFINLEKIVGGYVAGTHMSKLMKKFCLSQNRRRNAKLKKTVLTTTLKKMM